MTQRQTDRHRDLSLGYYYVIKRTNFVTGVGTTMYKLPGSDVSVQFAPSISYLMVDAAI